MLPKISLSIPSIFKKIPTRKQSVWQSNTFLKILIVYGAIMGLILTFIVAPLEKPDEIAHFFRTVSIAQGRITCPIKNGVFDNPLPLKITEFAKNLQYSSTANYYNSFNSKTIETEVLTETRVACTLPILSYIPSAIIISPFLWLETSANSIFFIGRFASLFLGFVVITWALIITPKKYRLITASAYILPMTWHQLGSFSKDSIHISAGVLAIALLLKLVENPNTNRTRNAVLMLISLFVVIVTRPQYLPLFLLIFIIPHKKHSIWRKEKYSIIKKVLSLTLIIFTLGLLLTTGTYTAPAEKLGLEPNYAVADADTQKQFLITHPASWFTVPYFTLIHHGEFLFKGMVGILGGLDMFFDWYIYFFFGIIIASFVYLSTPFAFKLKNKQLIFLFLSVFGTLTSILLAMYLYATPVGTFLVDGLQGRYFIVLLPPFVWLLAEIRHRHRYLFDVFVIVLITLSILKTTIGWYF